MTLSEDFLLAPPIPMSYGCFLLQSLQLILLSSRDGATGRSIVRTIEPMSDSVIRFPCEGQLASYGRLVFLSSRLCIGFVNGQVRSPHHMQLVEVSLKDQRPIILRVTTI